MGAEFLALRERVAPFTMTSPERLYAVYQAVRYVEARRLDGDIAECGVWRGGSSMMAALALLQAGGRRTLWLYDTFEGMPPPGPEDRKWTGEHARELLAAHRKQAGATGIWAWATLEDVRSNMRSTGYPEDLVRYVGGKVEETIPRQAPETLCLLRLDTDWYESTRHELEHLWDRLVPGGVLIIDDYGHWQGARRAVDEFFAATPVLLSRTDYTGRLAIKPG